MLFDDLVAAHKNADSAVQWADELYHDRFYRYFVEVHDMWASVSNVDNPISDNQLDICLTKLPLELFAVSEALASFKISIEAVKFEIKKAEFDQRKTLMAERTNETKEEIEKLVQFSGIENKFLLGVYTKIVERVENEMRFTREVIMACKKIYSARHVNDQPPVNESNTEPGANLPSYSPTPKHYIHGQSDISRPESSEDW